MRTAVHMYRMLAARSCELYKRANTKCTWKPLTVMIENKVFERQQLLVQSVRNVWEGCSYWPRTQHEMFCEYVQISCRSKEIVIKGFGSS